MPVPDSGLNVPALVSQIATPLLNHLADSSLTGAQFAEWFIGGYGEEIFRQVQQFGPFLEKALFGFPPLATRLEAIPKERLDKFIQEFLAFDPESMYEPEPGSDTTPAS
jgi:hypothetical protein